ncbi:MAG: D-alanyl-D-alanine carboxypeptidase family protein [Microthrixaceae bacterium]|nr:D-alanyl-D-alanine carboxypeptidase family protein [Microthrixaceae bacterium]
MRWGRGPRTVRQCRRVVTCGLLVAFLAPAGPAFAQDDHPDGGERIADPVDEAVRDATPGELRRRRAEVAERLEEAGSAAELARRTESEAARALAELDAALVVAQEAVASSALEVEEANAAVDVAEARSAKADRRARQAEEDLGNAAVDMFINPPQAASVQAALSGTIEQEMASTGLLVGRAESRRVLSLRRDRARAAATRAERAAQKAARDADTARAAAERAASELSAQLELRSEELRRIREDLALLEAEVADLELTDLVLETRLALDGLSQSGSVAAVRGPDGKWVTVTDGLPTRADMVQIGDTGVWVHNLVAANVTAMFLEALSDGVVLAGSAHRDSTRQIQLRASHCGTSYEALFLVPASSCSPPTARPGQSMHERGLAIDFTEGGRVLSRSSASFVWLSENAADFGFFNLPSEAWHWSVNGR